MSQKVIITGSTGMVGKGVLLECLESPVIEKVLLINRNSLKMSHSKIEEVLLKDFTKMEDIKDQLASYDACFHCMGVSSVGMSEADYSHLTFDVTKALADVLYDHNPNAVFIYVSGTGTDGSEKGRVMWARVKGKTENYILNKDFKDAYAFRPGVILPEKGIKSRTGWYNAMYVIARPFFPLMRRSKNITTTTRLGQAMINALSFPVESKLLENKEINELAGN